MKYIQINNDGTPIYSNTEGKLVKIGLLKKGLIYPRIKENGKYSELQFGEKKVYVLESATTPIYQAVFDLPKNKDSEGTIQLQQNTNVYQDNSFNDSFGEIFSGQTVEYYQILEDCYVINYLGRIGYINKEDITQKSDEE
ncbi:hypothetical protein ACQKP0_08530 [Heyndrickxia sp. NPDC080065]|uniref:hypothetical protein n=1 Tax=Heyndrickxia sp. NPDC080065 TaxID=3390568 RepID=UPI003D014716